MPLKQSPPKSLDEEKWEDEKFVNQQRMSFLKTKKFQKIKTELVIKVQGNIIKNIILSFPQKIP